MGDEKTETSKANETVVRHSTTADGLNIKFVSLASHKMVPSKFKDCFKKGPKQAKQLAKKYAAEKAFSIIADGRKEHDTSAPSPKKIVSALGSDEEVYSAGADCGMFAAVFTAYSHHYRLRTSPDDWWFCCQEGCLCYRSKLVESLGAQHVCRMKAKKQSKYRLTIPLSTPGITTSCSIK